MKRILQLTKLTIILLVFTIISKDVTACGLGGQIYVDTANCSKGVATLRLFNHTTTPGTIYFWQKSNDGGISWVPMVPNSSADTLNINPGQIGIFYRCRSTCPSGIAYSTVATIGYLQRFIDVKSKLCRTTALDNDSLVLKIKVFTVPTDTAYVKNYLWQSSSTNGIIWDNMPSKSDTLKIKFTAPIMQYRAFVSICPLTGPTYPGGTQQISPIDIGLDKIKLTLTDKDCINDTARLSLSSVNQGLKDQLKFKWKDVNLSGGAAFGINSTDTFLKTKADANWRKYTATLKFCDNFPTTDSTFVNYEINADVDTLKATYSCFTEQVSIDYKSRNQVIKDFFTYWVRSSNDTNNFTVYNAPVDTIVFSYPLVNKTNYFYRVHSKFCPSSTKSLDSTNIVNVKLNIDTGQLKATFSTCPNDSVYIKLLNYKDSSTFPLIKKWMYKPITEELFYIQYNGLPATDTTIAFRMLKGWTHFKKSLSLCPDKYAKQYESSIASTFVPFQAVDTIACSGPMTVRLFEDSVKLKDFSGTTIRSNATFSYQWLKSTNNKATFFIVPGANLATLPITSADKTAFFKRITKICATSPTQDTSNWSNLVFNNPNALNGKAEVFDAICLNDSVKICVVNFTPKVGDTATYIWQSSEDEITWTNILTERSNDSCIKVLVSPKYQYFRRLTYWCPSGLKDSSASTPLIYIQNLPWCESFTNQGIFGKDILFNCWRAFNPVCNSYAQLYTGGQLWSRTSGGKTDRSMSNWGPAAVDPKNPPGRKADIKLVTPAFNLKRGKIYRFSFWHNATTANICWDSLYVTWGTKATACDITNKFGDQLANYSFDQFNKFWADFIPQDDAIYYFAINLRDKDATTSEVVFDDICLKEIESCLGKNPVKGTTFAPSKLIDRAENPSKAVTYDKDKVTHQYCIHDTIMLTYQENNYNSNFDYYGMSYKFYKKREDKDWKINDTFFKEDTTYFVKRTPALPDTFLSYNRNNCHMYNRNDYHVKNVLVTDTNTWYKIVATCQFDGKEYHADSLLVNGTHSVPYCEDWEGVGTISQKQPPACLLPGGNSEQMVGKVPATFASCATCWAVYPQLAPTPGPTALDITLHAASVPLRNIQGTSVFVPQLDADAGWRGNNIVLINDGGAAPRATNTTREMLIMPAVRMYKNRGYRISFRWADNRKITQSPWGNLTQDLDSLYLVIVKGNQSGKTMDSFPRSKMVPGSLKRDLQSNITETGVFKYRTFWVDYMPSDTGTYYVAICDVPGPANGNPYRFQMDYFCIDTITVDKNCTDTPKFKDPLRLRISPDGKVWNPGDTAIFPVGSQWCVGNTADIEVDFGSGPNNNWSYGWKLYWQRSTNRITPNWTTFDSFVVGVRSTNRITYPFTYKYQDYRVILSNSCNTLGDTVGPFKVLPAGGDLPWREHFELYPGTIPPCWDVYSPCRVTVLGGGSIPPLQNEFNQKAKTPSEYLDMDFISPGTANCPMRTSVTAVPPGFGVTGGQTHRFSFWYKDNGISLPVDSIRAAWSYTRSTDVATNVLVNKINNDIVRNSKTNKWRYYTTEYTPTVDTTIHVKVTTYNISGKRMYRTMFDDFMMKFKTNIDALVIAIDSPDYNCDLSATTNLKVSVMNIGFNNIVDMPVKVSVDNGPPVSAIVPGVTGPNQVRTILVPNVDLSAPNIHKVRAWTDVVGEMDAYDDTFDTEIIHNELYAKPTDTIDSVCVCSNYKFNENSPNGMTRWYKTPSDANPFFIGDELQLDSVCKDTCLFRSRWNGSVCYTTPQNFSFGAPTYSTAAGGLTFDNISKDTLLIDSVMVYANSLSNAPFSISLTQFTGANQVTRALAPPYQVFKQGKQWIPIKIKVPPGTDYTLRYPGGTAALAILPGFIYIGSGCPSLQFNIQGDETYPAAATSYKYFFNMKIVKIGCESDRVKICFKTIPSPKFKIKDTNRVCSRPLYPICGPNAPTGSTYKYSWNTSSTDTLSCVYANNTGWYKLTVTNDFGCVEQDSLNLTVDPSPIFTLGPDTSFCRYTPYIIKSGLDPLNNVVTWSDNQAGVNISILNPGTYIATAYNTANFCSSKDTILVNRRELPVFDLGLDRVFCGSSANLQALASNLPPLTYTWGGPNGSTPPIITTLGKNKYWLDGVDIYGCKNSDTIEANLVANPIFDLGPDLKVCGSFTTLNGPVGKYRYKWSTTATSRTLTVAAPGTYSLTITDSIYGCTAVDSVKVSFLQVPVFDLGPDITKCATTHIITGPAADGYTYTWQSPKGTNIGTGNPYIADKSGVYYLVVVNNGCLPSYTDSVKITLKTPAMNAIDLLKDTFGCKQVNLIATSKNNYSKIQWGFPLTDTGNLVKVTTSGAYSVALTNECGTATKSVNIRVDNTPTANFSVNSYPDCMSVLLTNLSTNGVTYLWQFGDNTTSTDLNPLHVYTAEGDYLITLRTYNACGFAAKTLPIAKRIKNCNSSGIQSTTLAEAQVYVYPNPSKGSTQLIGVGLPNGMYKVSISNLLGQTVQELNSKVIGNQIDETLDLTKFASGEYLVNISSDTESIVRKLQVIK